MIMHLVESGPTYINKCGEIIKGLNLRKQEQQSAKLGHIPTLISI